MPPGSKTQGDMSLRHILNPAEDTNRAQRSRPHVRWRSSQGRDDLGYSKEATHDTFEDNSSDSYTTDDDNNLKIGGRAAPEHQLPSTDKRNASHQLNPKRRVDQPTEEHQIKARMPRIGFGLGESKAKIQRSSSPPVRKGFVLSKPTDISDDEMDPEDTSSELSTGIGNTQESNLSSLPSGQESSQTTQYSSYNDVSECRCSSSDLVRQQGGSSASVNAYAPSSRKFRNQIHHPRKRQRTSSSPESGKEAGPGQRKLAKSFHYKATSSDSYKARRVEVGDSDAEGPSIKNSGRETSSWSLAVRGVPSAPLVLSPSRSNIYTRRQSTSPNRLPILDTPRRRDQRIYREPSLQAPSPETNNRNFSIFTAILAHPELTLEVSKHLDVKTLLDLYAISKDYHALVDNRFTALVMAQAIGKASESAQVFSFRAYRNLCKRDPAGRIMLFNVSNKEGVERVAKASDNDVRFVPSFRWLKMVLHHEAVVDCILRCLAQEGHRLPKRTTLVLKKLWFTLDITDNGRRIGVLHDEQFWSKRDLFVVTMFFVKLDMRLTDPITGTGETGMRKLLMAQKGLETLARVLARQELKSQLELLRLIVRYDYTPSRPLRQDETIFGIPANEVGKLCYEGWGKGDKKLVPIDELIAREAVRRRLNLQDHYVDMMLYGYINKRTFEDIETPTSLLPIATDSESDGDTVSSGSETEEEAQQEILRLRRERMGLFEGETDLEDQEAADQQEDENSLDEQRFGL